MKKIILSLLLSLLSAPMAHSREINISKLRSLIYEVKKETTVYHWSMDKDFLKPKNPDIKGYVEQTIKASKDELRGLYLGIDPMFSSKLGKQVLAVKLKKGARIINVQDLEALEAVTGDYYSEENDIEREYQAKFLETVKKFLEKENISLIQYNYGTQFTSFCNRDDAPFALVALNSSGINFESTQLIHKKTSEDSKEGDELVFIENVFRHSLGPFPVTYPFRKTEKVVDVLKIANERTLMCTSKNLLKNLYK
jgi:hypothetical protein